jgi:hypothetical protein
MSNEFLESPPLKASAKDDNENYSEWRLLRLHGLFNWILVNSGFQVRDFKTNRGTSVVDPEIYCKLQKEANSIWWSLSRCPLMVLLFFLAMCERTIVLLLPLGPVACSILFYLLLFPVLIVPYRMLYARADNRTRVLVDSYKEHFLKEYGVELGYRGFATSVVSAIYLPLFGPSIYLRRPHTSREEKDFGDTIPPIFIDRTMPGDVDLFMTANLDLTDADAKACYLLQSTYLEEVNMQPSPIVRYFFVLLPIILMLSFLSELLKSVMSFCYVLLMVLLVMDAIDFGNRKALRAASQCQEVAQRMNEALQNDKDIAGTLSVEFSTSQLPGRDTQPCRRFQFVRHSTAPSTRNEMTDVSGCE